MSSQQLFLLLLLLTNVFLVRRTYCPSEAMLDGILWQLIRHSCCKGLALIYRICNLFYLMSDSLPCNECHLASIHMRQKYLQLLCLFEESFIYKSLPRPPYHQSFSFKVSNHLVSLTPVNQYP